MKRLVAVVVCLLMIGSGTASEAQTAQRFPTNELAIEQVYLDVFGRFADAEGLDYWNGQLASGVSIGAVYNEFVGSEEFGGTVAPVTRLYLSVFGRQPDLEGLRFWVGRRQDGATLEELANAFLSSGEFEAVNGDRSPNEIVEAVYERVLGRTPDAEGLQFWTAEITEGRLNLAQFVVAVSESPEHITRRNPEVLVTTVYLGLLQRLPEPDGADFWSDAVRNGASLVDLIDSILLSEEYGNRFPFDAVSLTETTLADGFTIPWDVAPLPGGGVLVTERGGGFTLVAADGAKTSVSADLDDLFAQGETGLMGLALAPDFADTGRFYSCQGHRSPSEIQVISWDLDGSVATRVADPLVGGLPLSSGRHGGCQLEVAPDGALIVATGDAATGSLPQNLTSLGGKVLRVDPDTGVGMPDNPFSDSANANTQRILSFGHRNVQGVALHPETGQVWTAEHGPSRDDEVNRIVPGGNYGWDPVPGYNESVPMTDSRQFPEAIPAAWATGAPTLALADVAFISHPSMPFLQNGLLVSALKGQRLMVLFFNDEGSYRGQQVLLDNRNGRLRGVAEGPDGSIYVTTSNGRGNDKVIQLTPGG